MILLVGTTTRARSLAAIDESLIQGKVTWNAADPKQKQIEPRNLEDRASIESSGRSVFGRIRHYIGTHKELLASDALLVAALSADAISSLHCIHLPREVCYETDPLFPSYPSELFYWGVYGGEEAAYITASHLWWHKHPDSPWRHIVWAVPIASSIWEIPNVQSNLAQAAEGERLREARARVTR